MRERETVGELIKNMRETLVPQGRQDLIRLELRNHGYVDGDLVRKAIDELALHMTCQELMGSANALEQLGAMLLLETLDRKK